MDEVELTGEEALLMSRITTIDRDLDDLERRTRESVIHGLHSSGAAMMTNLQQTSADEEHGALVAERADLVEHLKQAVATSEATPS